MKTTILLTTLALAATLQAQANEPTSAMAPPATSKIEQKGIAKKEHKKLLKAQNQMGKEQKAKDAKVTQ